MLKKLGLSKKQCLLLIGSVFFNFLIYNGARALSSGLYHHDLSLAADKLIPFLPGTVLIYWGGSLFWAVNYYLGVRCDRGNGYRFIGAHYIGEAICFFFFVLFPTSMARPEITGNSPAAWLLGLTYRFDAADNLFPSIHCFAGWLCFIGVRNNARIPVWYRRASLVIAAAICVSTLTVKQHVIPDVPAGIALAEISYGLSAMLERRIQKHAG